MRLEAARRASSQFTQLPKATTLQKDSISPQTALQALLGRLLNDLTTLSEWLNAITQPQDASNDKSVALQKSVRHFPASPSAPLKLLPQIHTAVESTQWQGSSAVFVFDDVTVNFAAMEARRHGTLVTLKAKEFKVLTYLIRNSGRVVSRDELLTKVWGYKCYPRTRTVDNHVFNLRQKLEPEPSRPRHFLTIRGAGYKFLPLPTL